VTMVSTAMIPREPVGKYTRLVIDIDDYAVRDYIAFDAKGSSDPWPLKVIQELADVLMEWAGSEEISVRMATRQQR
jgi:hypothetical protein